MLLLRQQMHDLRFCSMSPASPVNQHLTTVADELENECSTAGIEVGRLVMMELLED